MLDNCLKKQGENPHETFKRHHHYHMPRLTLLTANVGCNTMAGIGEDLELAGQSIEEEAED